MATIRTFRGPAQVADNSISRILAPAPGLPFTQVWGPGGGEIDALDTPQSIIAQLQINPPLAQFTTPIGTLVWVKVPAVTLILPPPPNYGRLPGDAGHPIPPIGCVLEVGGRLQSIGETHDAAESILAALGWNPPHVAAGFAPKSSEVVYSEHADTPPFSPW